eukprot:m.359497 g.359497  ORF g.359497 m.359497 type:complete len:1421 (-) comp18596_c0_seq1:107-4369(-)
MMIVHNESLSFISLIDCVCVCTSCACECNSQSMGVFLFRTGTMCSKKELQEGQHRCDIPHPLDGSFLSPHKWWSYLSFSYMASTFRQGYREQLKQRDLFPVPSSSGCDYMVSRAERLWHEQLQRPNGSLAKAYVKVFGGRWLFATFFLLLELLLMIGEPLALGYVISAITSGAAKGEVFKFAGILIVLILSRILLHHVAFMFVWRLGYDLMATTAGLLYRKALKVNGQAFTKISMGHVTNLVSNDVERFVQFSVMGHYLYLAPIQTIIAAYFIWQQIGIATLCALSGFITLLPINLILGKVFAKLRTKTALLTDERIKHINEILSGIRVLKMYAWENPFKSIISDTRKKELVKIRRTNTIRACNMGYFFVSQALTGLLGFITYELVVGDLDAEKVFVTLAMAQSIRLGIAFFFPAGIQSLSEVLVSMKRFESFLRLHEHQGLKHHDGLAEGNMSKHEDTSAAGSGIAYAADSASPENGAIEQTDTNTQSIHRFFVPDPALMALSGSVDAGKNPIDQPTEPQPQPQPTLTLPGMKFNNVTASWKLDPERRSTLSNIDFEAKNGELITIVGPVGAGKSSLLQCALGELLPSSGSVEVLGRVGYSSQEGWILNDTFKNNLLFGHEYNPLWFNTVLRACNLERDITLFQGGVETEIGERGVTLSGGQKARLSLARAVYGKPDIVLLDDPLSAVDAKVGRSLFADCVCGLLKDTTRLLVTHQLQFLKASDRIIVMNRDGTIQAIGDYDYHLAQNTGLSAILQAHADDEAAHDEAETKTKKKAALTGDEKHEGLEGDANIVQAEQRKEGTVSASTYWRYIKSMGSFSSIFFWIIIALGTQVVVLVADWYLTQWVDMPTAQRESVRSLGTYGGLVGALIVLSFARAVMYMYGTTRASHRIHDRALGTVINTPTRFFDVNPLGRILNRFSKDTGFMDDLLPWTLLDFTVNVVYTLGIILLVCSIVPWLFLALIPLVIAFRFLQVYYMRTAREVKRLEAVSRSPLFAHFNETLAGLSTLRSHLHAPRAFSKKFDRLQDGVGSTYMAFVMTSRWLGFRLDVLTFLMTAATLFVSVALRDRFGPGTVGLLVTYMLQLTNMFQWTVRQGAEVENQMTAIERLLDYTQLPREEETVGGVLPEEADKQLVASCSSKGWPEYADVRLKNLSLRYAPDQPLRLHNIDCYIPSGAKVGVIGRTGAGKSSLLAALFRLAPTTGSVEIGGVDVNQLPLQVLRSRLSVIPQDPVLYSSTVRHNLDPFDEYDDDQVWEALRLVQLDQAVSENGGLHQPMSEAGSNFSVGQRQLVCLARAVLRTSRVLVMDEATANVDTETDTIIQQTIRKVFAECTVITIAHRLNSILDSDLVMVMDAGRLVQFDKPEILLQDPKSLFSQLVDHARLSYNTVVGAAINRKTSIRLRPGSAPATPRFAEYEV